MTAETTCPNCGAVIPEGLATCPHCGAMLEQAAEAGAGAEAAALETPAAPSAAALASETPTTPPAPTVLPPLEPALQTGELQAVSELLATPGVHVQRHVTANVQLSIPQASVDKRGLLTPEQWARLLQAYDEALERRMREQLEQGRMDFAAMAQHVPIPWEAVGAGEALTLSAADQREIEQNLRAIWAQVPQIRTQQTVALQTPKVRVGCGVMWVACAGLVLLPMLAHWVR